VITNGNFMRKIIVPLTVTVTFSNRDWSFRKMGNTSCDCEMVVRKNDKWGFRCGKLTNPKTERENLFLIVCLL
jgi:hypothetical protein